MPIPALAERQNTAALGDVLYTNYVYFFQLAGLVLLVAMIGAIVLTLRDRPGTKRQDIARQIDRSRRDTLEVVSVKTGAGMVVPPKPAPAKAPEPAEGNGHGGGHH